MSVGRVSRQGLVGCNGQACIAARAASQHAILCCMKARTCFMRATHAVALSFIYASMHVAFNLCPLPQTEQVPVV